MLSRSIKGIPALAILTLLALSVSCARYPPGQNGLSGHRLVVTLTFQAPINSLYYYYFLINNAGDMNAPGPVPVLGTPYGNGFATGSGDGGKGFTDFVLFYGGSYRVYHVQDNPNAGNFIETGRPVSSVMPDLNDPNTANKLQFTIDMSQLQYDTNGRPLSMPPTIRWLQVNVVATNIVPHDATEPVAKIVDSLGDNRANPGGTFQIIDMSQNSTYSNANASGTSVYEPTGDVVGATGDQGAELDLTDWSFQVQNQ